MAILKYSVNYIENIINQISGKIINYLRKKKILSQINLFLLIIFISSFSLIGNNYISYKLIYFIQFFILLIFIIQDNKFKINHNILIINSLLILFLFFEINRYFYYVLFICFFTTFFQLTNFNLQIKKKFNGIFTSFIFLLIFLLLAKTKYTSPSFEIEYITILDEIFKNFNEYKNCTDSNCNFKFINYRYTVFSLPQNFSGIFLSIIFYLLLKQYKKKTFILLFSFFNFIIFYITWSKSMLLFYSFVVIQSFFRISIRKLILTFLILNFFKIFPSVALVDNFDNPWKQENTRSMEKIYEKDFCTKIKNYKIFISFSNCGDDYFKKIDFLGYSSFYKFYSYGLLFKNIKKNFINFILPNPERRLIKQNKISQFEAENDLSVHSMLLMCFLKLGILITFLFFINLIILSKNIIDYNLFYSFLFSSTFLSLDLYLIFPLIIISQYSFFKERF